MSFIHGYANPADRQVPLGLAYKMVSPLKWLNCALAILLNHTVSMAKAKK